jgi:GNAT superfamily N-acetyltransferase
MADVPRLAELNRAAIEELAPMRGGAVWKAREARQEPFAEQFEELLDLPERRVLVATIDGAVVGYAVARLDHVAGGRVLGVIDDIFVEEGARQVGLGELMINDLMAWCQERKCIGIDAMALPGHRATKNFFEESGFTARQLVMHHAFDDEGAGG